MSVCVRRLGCHFDGRTFWYDLWRQQLSVALGMVTLTGAGYRRCFERPIKNTMAHVGV